jgi:hypothetical protein
MDNLMKLVTTALEWTYAQEESDVTAQTLEAASQLLMLQRDTIQVIDAPVRKESPTTPSEESSIKSSISHSQRRKHSQNSKSKIDSEF